MTNLELALSDYCDCCGRGYEATINYVKEHDNNPRALYEEAIKLKDNELTNFIIILTCHNYNIFVPWFKSLLLWCKENKDNGIGFHANDILNYYNDAYTLVNNLEDEVKTNE